MSSSRIRGGEAGPVEGDRGEPDPVRSPGGATQLVDVTMPQMGVSVAEGTVVAWRIEVGDRIEAEQTICEISTDKIDTEVPAPASGVVAEILVPVESTVSVGAVLARIASAAPGAPDGKTGAPGEGTTAAPGEGTTAAPGDRTTAAPGDRTTAAPGEGMTAAPGDRTTAAPGEGTTAAPDEGTTAAPENGAAGNGTGAGAQAGAPTAAEPPPSPTPAHDALGTGAPSVTLASRTAPAPASRRYSPVVQRIAAEHGIDVSQIEGTGRGGRVRKQDVLAFVDAAGPAQAEPPLHIESPYRPEPAPAAPPPVAPPPEVPGPAAPAPVAPPPEVPGPAAPASAPATAPQVPAAAAPLPEGGQLSRMRRQIGEHMKRSLQIAAHCTTWIEVDMSRVEAARARFEYTALPFVARATIAALREHRALNARLEDERYTRPEEINLGIAVSLGEDGLIVPVVHRAHELSVEGLAARIKDLARRARSRELTPDEVRGGTFTITNPGQYGSIMATPIINQPQVAILDLEAVTKHPVVVTDADGNDSIAIRPTTILGLSWDHRALDGAQAAQFLASMKRRLEGWNESEA